MTVMIALAGNPNVGKSTLFNALTGSKQHVGNWPGKTVEKKEGRLRVGGEEILLVDLPGAYSLTAYSIEEIITRDFIINERPTAVVAVVDASNLERNLYLVAQVLELETPVIIVLNMTDVASSRGLKIDAKRLSEQMDGVPVVETVGNRSLGLEPLKQAITQISENPPHALPKARFDGILGDEMAALAAQIEENPALTARYHPKWLATKLLEEDEAILEVMAAQGETRLLQAAVAAQERIEEATEDDAETLIADQRYSFIGSLVDTVLERPSESILTTSDKIDEIVTHRIWGLPIFLMMMWLVFQFTANVSAPFLDWIDGFINSTIYGWAGALLTAVGLGETWLAALITDGIIAGVGGVLVFVPVLLFLYFALAVLEDSGYMARAAFVMDRVMRWMGLHGKSFLPLIVGFGCTVPAVYATRTLENEKDRKLTGFLATFMSCGARLPVYVVFGAAFFGTASGNLIFSMYLVGIGVALATGFALKHTVYKGQQPAPFVMELPPYRMPRPQDVWRQMWERVQGFVKKASTVILVVSTVLWLLMAVPGRANAGSFNGVAADDSLFAVVSGAVSPIFRPAGFGSWEASGSLITGFMAKEVIVGTMNQIYVGEGEAAPADVGEPTTFGQDVGHALFGFGEAAVLTVQEVLNIAPRTINLLPAVNIGEFNFFGTEEAVEDNTRLESALITSFERSAGSAELGALAAVAFNIFVLLYVPCMVAVAAMRQEFGSRWTWAQIGYTLAVAWVAAVLVFQIGKLFV
ncbi:MAG: ferrous iron transport protein B [Ardenticatenaceae bacterium]|nr:MAG: ferrous iron transport protein B [Ardenticatenaceae bacterium]